MEIPTDLREPSSWKTRLNGQLHENPALYAGIAAGLGFALGLTGRIARHRMAKRNRPLCAPTAT